MRAGDRVVGAPEVGHQHPGELLLEEPLQRRAAAAAVDHVAGDVPRREAPQPMGLAVDPPAGLVGVRDGASQGLRPDLVVPGRQDLPQPPPHLDQAAGREPEPQVEVEDVRDLGQRHAQQIMQPRRERHDPQPDRRAGQGVGDGRLDGRPAMRAPVAMDRVLGDDGGDVGGGVLDDPRPRAPTQPHRPMADGAGRERVLLATVDPLGRRPSPPGMPRGRPLGLPAALGRRLDVRGRLPRGGRRIDSRRRAGRLLGQLFGQAQEREDDRVLTLLEDPRRLLGGQMRAEHGLKRGGVKCLHARGRHRGCYEL